MKFYKMKIFGAVTALHLTCLALAPLWGGVSLLGLLVVSLLLVLAWSSGA